MEELIDFFTEVPKWFRASIIVGGLVGFWLLEGVVPLYRFQYDRWRHAGVNLLFTLSTVIIAFAMAGLLLWASDTVAENEFGLLYLIDMPLWLQVVVGVLLMDLIGAYLIHFVEHRVKWLWKFHLVHHSDTNIDVTSGLRHHPGEAVFRVLFTIAAVIIIGAPMGIIMLYQTLSGLFAHLTHTNTSPLGKWDRAFSYLFVTPDMHKVHHHYTQPWTDTNFGNIFSVWDRLFGTFQYVDDMNEIKYGIDTHMKPEEHSKIGNLLAIPFQKYRVPPESKFGSE